MRLAVFTDLDGSLLDHDTYDFSAAVPALEVLSERGIPVIPCTSKTMAEMLPLREQLGNHASFIVENGAGVYLPIGTLATQPNETTRVGNFWCRAFAPPRSHWLPHLERLRAELEGCFEPFSAMHSERIAELTGLPLAQAEQAGDRQFGEAIAWHGSDDQKELFIKAMQTAGANVLEGGRFLHVVGNADKAKAMQWLADCLGSSGEPISTLALGDGKNDIGMLEAADFAVLIRSPVNSLPDVARHTKFLVTHSCGPEGWAEGIEWVIDQIEQKQGESLHG